MMRAKPLTDLFQPWYASRELLLHDRDPYGPEVTREIQVAFYGKELNETVGIDGSGDQRFALAYRFAYPLYIVFLVAPVVWMPFPDAQIVVLWFLALVTALSVLLWFHVMRKWMPAAGLVGLCALVLTSLPVMQGLNLRQPALLVAGLIAAAAASTVSGHLFLAGAMLALATIKPQVALLPIAWFVLWTSSEWKQRQALVWGLVVTLTALLLASQFLLPGWLMRFPGALQDYARYTGGASLIGMLLPTGLRWLVLGLVVWVTTGFCWRARKQPANADLFAPALALVLNISVMVMPTVFASYNQVLLIPAAILIAESWNRLWQRGVVVRAASSILATVALLPWLLVILTLVPTIVRGRAATVSWAPAFAGLGVPFAVFGLLVLLSRASDPAPVALSLNKQTCG
jgi:hypothetical protein